MALIAENGQGLPNAESYMSVAEADAYHAAFGNAKWGDLDLADKEVYLRRATAYMTQMYRLRWKGERLTLTQSLDWPRHSVPIPDFSGRNAYLPQNVIPNAVTTACAELALKASAGELAPDLERAVLEEQVGPLSVKYDKGSPQQVRYTAIDMALSPYLHGGSGNVNVKVVRS